MHRIDHATADGGQFTEGNPSVGLPATVVTDDWLNDVQENLAGFIEAAGVALTKGRAADLEDAILAVIASSLAGYALAGHNHDGTYLKLTGGTLTDSLVLKEDFPRQDFWNTAVSAAIKRLSLVLQNAGGNPSFRLQLRQDDGAFVANAYIGAIDDAGITSHQYWLGPDVALQLDASGLRVLHAGALRSVLHEGNAPISTESVSALQTITNGGSISIAHGLGVEPKSVVLTLECQTAELGWSVGERAEVAPWMSDAGFGCSVRKGAANVDVHVGPNGFTLANRASGNGIAAITPARWKLETRALS